MDCGNDRFVVKRYANRESKYIWCVYLCVCLARERRRGEAIYNRRDIYPNVHFQDTSASSYLTCSPLLPPGVFSCSSIATSMFSPLYNEVIECMKKLKKPMKSRARVASWLLGVSSLDRPYRMFGEIPPT
jgi:hypothetical protein